MELNRIAEDGEYTKCATELFTSKWLILCYMNFTSIHYFKKEEEEIKEEEEEEKEEEGHGP